jgi:hypothetical protein
VQAKNSATNPQPQFGGKTIQFLQQKWFPCSPLPLLLLVFFSQKEGSLPFTPAPAAVANPVDLR